MVDMALRKNRTEPCRESAATMKIPEQRLSRLSPLVHTVKIGVQRIGQLARGARTIDGLSSAIQVRPHLQDEMIPGVGMPFRTRAREREIFQVKR